MRIRIFSILSALLLVTATACGSDDPEPIETTTTSEAEAAESTDSEGDSGEDSMADMVLIEDAWARTSPMMASNGAAYMEITSPVDDRLIGATSVDVIAESIEIHETSMDEESGEMMMRQVDGINLPAGETVSLAPGGYHVMFLGLTAPLEIGANLELVLTFENAGEITIHVEVRDNADMPGMENDMQHTTESSMDDDH